MYRLICIWVISAAFVIAGCSHVNHDCLTPDLPGKQDKDERQGRSERILWGIWNITFDPDSGEVCTEPLRNLDAHFNITSMVQPPACDNCLMIEVNTFDPVTRIMDVDVTLWNKYAITGHDVRGILFTTQYGHTLVNADGWIDLFDIAGGDTINPFMSFGKYQDQRAFPNGYVDIVNCRVYIPKPPQYWALKFAVEASWPGNCKEPYSIDDFTQTQLGSNTGSKADIQVQVHDWQDDVNFVTLEAPDITGQPFTTLSHISGDTWGVEITNAEGAGEGDYPVRIFATSANSGTQRMYQLFIIKVTGGPTGNGWVRTWGGPTAFCHGSGLARAGDYLYASGDYDWWVDFNPGPPEQWEGAGNPRAVYVSKFDMDGNYKGVKTFGPPGAANGGGMTTDPYGDVYVVGYIEQTVDMDPGGNTYNLTSKGGADAFVSKFDSDLNFQWSHSWGDTGYDTIYTIVFDDMGNVFLGGNFEGTIDFDPGPGEDFHTHVGSYDAFLTKLTPDGDYVWTKTWGSPGIDWVMTQKREGQYLYNGGNFTGTIDFDPGPGVDWHTADDESDVFIIKMTVGGDFIWARTWDADAKLHYIGWGIQTDGLGHFYVCGWYQGKADFDPGPGVANCTSNGDRDIYLSKFDTDGNFIWVKAWGGPGYDQAHFLTIGPTGDIWVSSGFSNSLDIDPGPGVVNRTSKGDLDIGISIFDPDGNFLWDRSWGGAGRDWGNGFFFTENQELFMIGWFEQTVDWDPGPGVENHTAQGYKDPFLLKLLSNGYWE